MMARRMLVGILAAAVLGLAPGNAGAAEAEAPPTLSWPHGGLFGAFDRAAIQRGLQVYTESCSSCHSLRLLSYRNLLEIGYSEDEAKAYAAQFEVEDGPDAEGEMFMRPAILRDRFVSPFPNENAARASNNGALPPDLSVIVKARKGGEDYIHALLTGYREPPEGHELADGMSYNPYFPSADIAMPPPLDEDAVEYADGTPATVDRMARDVSQFLTWAAEPTLEERKRLGFKVMVFLVILAGMLYLVKRRVWSDLH